MALASFSPYGSHKVFSPFAFNSLYPMQRNTDLYRRVRTEILAKCSRLVVKKPCFLQKSMKLLIKREPETEYIPTPHFPTWETFKHQYAYMISLYLKKKKKSWMIFSELLGNINTTANIIPQGLWNSSDNFVLLTSINEVRSAVTVPVQSNCFVIVHLHTLSFTTRWNFVFHMIIWWLRQAIPSWSSRKHTENL